MNLRSHSLSTLAVLATLMASVQALSQTPQERMSRFATLFNSATTHKYAKIVWQKEGVNNRKPNFDVVYGGSQIFAVDTKDGVVRTLVPFQDGPHWSGATFTPDGAKVIYFDNVGLNIRIVDWNGSNDRILLKKYEGEGHCWKSTDGKQWILATEAKNSGKLYRINIADTTEKVLIYSPTWARVGYAGTTCWASMSLDGKYLAAGWPNYGDLKILDVTSGTLGARLAPNGCWISISPDNAYNILYTNDGSASHKEIYITSRTGTVVLQKNLFTEGILKASDEIFESLRYTNDPNFVSLFSAPEQACCSFDATGTSNPKIIRLDPLASAAVMDNCETPEGDAGVFVYVDGTGVISPAQRGMHPDVALGAPIPGLSYDVRGRTLTTTSKGVPSYRGVFITAGRQIAVVR